MSDCPYPEKQRHKSFPAALAARDSLEAERGIDLGLRPYRCGDHWHLGHKSKPFGKKGIQWALKSGSSNARKARRRRTR